ncbi:MAG: hypothetical protein DRN71_04340 [Candidatus Nanohalarchaeota archaeon]|nr:MAG: hypothetical protein DRN71_04340 [Candidatus Nanohaloarchaeota archaeon]
MKELTKNFKSMQDCLFWIRYNLAPKTYYMGIPKILELFGESDIPYPHDTLFSSSIRRKISLSVSGTLKFTITPIPKKFLFGITKKGKNYMILFIRYPTYEKMLIDNILLGYNYPLERKYEYDYDLVREYLKNVTKKEQKQVMSKI